MYKLACNSFPNNWKLNIWGGCVLKVYSPITLHRKWSLYICICERHQAYKNTSMYAYMYVVWISAFCSKVFLLKRRKLRQRTFQYLLLVTFWHSYNFVSMDSFLIVFRCIYLWKPLRKDRVFNRWKIPCLVK